MKCSYPIKLTLLLSAFATGGCGILSSSAANSPLTASNQMTLCSWSVQVNGVQQTIAAGTTVSLTATASTTVLFTVTAASGSCSLSSTTAGANSTSTSNGSCLLNASLAATLTLILQPVSGDSASSNTPNNTVLVCP
jgi:hypothetical protein